MSETMPPLLYFAYGSNMFTRRLTAPNRTPSAIRKGTGFVSGHRLTFDKISKDGSGKCDMEPGSPADRVYGVLFTIAQGEACALDRAEGAGYGKLPVQVTLVDRTITAIAYAATKKGRGCRPYSWYKAFVVAGAVEHGLPNDYIEYLRAFPAQTDPNATRRSENEAVLFGV